eukprot:TRINITY_DN3114_c0_g1_i9.p1 TRINITY_DN3114_c0_g1~~TRINITY_DN3114_c0_g1_i9.p1  ORF type:complete len:644 (+),score=186.17 TRINITY_DN3114_c0_g1_i9:30-1961(+)
MSWSWSNVANLTLSSLNNVTTTYILPTLDNVSKKTSTLVNQLADAIDDEPGAPQDAPPRAPAEATEEAPGEAPGRGEGDLEEEIFSLIGNGVSMISSSAGYLTGMVKDTAEFVETTKVTVTHQIMENEVLGKGVQMGAQLVEQSLSALEKVLLPDIPSKDKAAHLKQEEISFSNFFKEVNGFSHLETLQNLSLDLLLKSQINYKNLSPTSQSTIDSQFSRIHLIFKELEDVEIKHHYEIPPLSELGPKVNTHLISTVECYNHYKQPPHPTLLENDKPIDLILQSLHSKELEYTRILAKLCAISIEHILMIAEWYSDRNNLKDIDFEQFESIIKRNTILCNYFEQELHFIMTVAQEGIEKISSSGAEILKLRNETQMIQTLQLRAQEVIKSLFVHLGSAIANINETKNQLIPIAKYVIMVLEQLHQPTEETNVLPEKPSLIENEPSKDSVNIIPKKEETPLATSTEEVRKEIPTSQAPKDLPTNILSSDPPTLPHSTPASNTAQPTVPTSSPSTLPSTIPSSTPTITTESPIPETSTPQTVPQTSTAPITLQTATVPTVPKATPKEVPTTSPTSSTTTTVSTTSPISHDVGPAKTTISESPNAESSKSNPAQRNTRFQNRKAKAQQTTVVATPIKKDELWDWDD